MRVLLLEQTKNCNANQIAGRQPSLILFMVAVMRFTRVLLPFVIILVAGCATPDVKYGQKDVFDVLEVALRHRLETWPLPPHSRCYVSIENTDVAAASFAGRFPEFQMTVRRDAPERPEHQRWYHLRVGQTTQNDAWVLLTDAAGMMTYHLRRKDGHWVVIFSERPFLT